ncbi:MAG: M15 family metallopeptidase [Treponema sp.]|nr:M15 family metallopeptidase [Treponema sp.]
MKNKAKSFFIAGFFSFLVCCAGREIPAQTFSALSQTEEIKEKVSRVLKAAEIPEDMARFIEASAVSGSNSLFLSHLEGVLINDDPYLRILVDKQHPLPEDYEPGDLIELQYKSYRAGITDVMMLRRKAEAALEEMAAAAKTSGHTLTISSAYRSYQYQIGSFERWTARLGLERAEMVSARPGRSQHQLGLVVDFGSISNNFAETAAGKWTASNAGRFGFSLSYPRSYEKITGYDWESWHYRYVGRELVTFIDTWFDGIQQYALRFIHEWEAEPSEKH